MIGTNRNSWIKIVFACLLLVGLPIFIWAVLTQRIELRKRAATAEPVEICWNRVIPYNGSYGWPNSCKGSPRTDLTCTQIIIPLTTEEIAGYQTWVSMGKPYIPGCGGPPTPTCRPRPPCLDATPRCLIPITSDMCPPPGPTPTPAIPSECTPCMTNSVCPEGLVCQGFPLEPNGSKNDGSGYSIKLLCVKSDGSSRCPITTPTPTPVSCAPNGSTCTILCPAIPYCPIGQTCPSINMPFPCSAQNLSPKGICQNNRCMPTYPTSYQSPTPTPTLACGRGTPIVRLAPNDQSGNPGQTLTYTANIVNTDSQPCGSSTFNFAGNTAPGVDSGFITQFQYNSMPIPASASAHMNVFVTSPATNSYPDTRSLPISIAATNTASNQSAWGYASYTFIKPAPQQLKFLVKLAGVNGAEAKGAAITVKLKLKDGTVLPFDKPLVLDAVGNGVYEATATLTNPLPAGTSFRVLIKGEKHSQMVYCRQSGQTDPCNDTEYITPSTYSFDFSGRPLPPGDLNQDGKVNADDLKLITDLFQKPSSQQTPQDLKTVDVNYSGKIDSLDLSLVFQTLETRYDEQ